MCIYGINHIELMRDKKKSNKLILRKSQRQVFSRFGSKDKKAEQAFRFYFNSSIALKKSVVYLFQTFDWISGVL